jgi:hypothetical protein
VVHGFRWITTPLHLHLPTEAVEGVVVVRANTPACSCDHVIATNSSDPLFFSAGNDVMAVLNRYPSTVSAIVNAILECPLFQSFPMLFFALFFAPSNRGTRLLVDYYNHQLESIIHTARMVPGILITNSTFAKRQRVTG